MERSNRRRRQATSAKILWPILCSAVSREPGRPSHALAALARASWGLERSVAGHFMRNQRTAFRVWFSYRVFKIQDNKSRAILSNWNQSFWMKPLLSQFLWFPISHFPSTWNEIQITQCPLAAELSLSKSRNWIDLKSKGFLYFPISTHFPHSVSPCSWTSPQYWPPNSPHPALF